MQVLLEPGTMLLVKISDNTYQQFSYDDVMAGLVRKSKLAKSRASRTPEVKASRAIGLLGRAIVTGKWSTGATIDKGEAFDKLIRIVEALPSTEKLTDNAKGVINALCGLQSDVPNLAVRQGYLRNAYSRGIS